MTIGRQNLYADGAAIAKAYAASGGAISDRAAEKLAREGGGFAEPIFRELGADQLDSLDASAYEGSSIVHDLNRPLPDALRGAYSLVFDGGSLEHIFNFPQALKNCMEAVAVGGHFVTITPANNLFGHGFYQFSPDLFYSALAPANGFSTVVVLLRSVHRWAHWHAVSDPEKVGGRVTMTSPWSSLLFVLARRTSLVEPFTATPQQSDYVTAWSNPRRPVTNRSRLYEQLPGPLRRTAKVATTFAGTISHRDHFKRVELIDVARGSRIP